MSETFTLLIKPSKVHIYILIGVSALSITALFWVAVNALIQLILSVLIVLVAIVSFRQINANTPHKIMISQPTQTIIFDNQTQHTTQFACLYQSNWLSIIKLNKQVVVIFYDSCERQDFWRFNLFLRYCFSEKRV